MTTIEKVTVGQDGKRVITVKVKTPCCSARYFPVIEEAAGKYFVVEKLEYASVGMTDSIRRALKVFEETKI